jgi:hypothetical protein
MHRLRIAGALWIALAGLSIATTVIFRVDSSQILATTALGVATAVLGSWILIVRGRNGIAASVMAGIVWLVLYLGLAVVQSGELAAWVTDAFLAFAATIPALMAWTARRQLEAGP